MTYIIAKSEREAIPIKLATEASLSELRHTLSPEHQTWLQANAFKAKAGQFCLLPSDDHGIQEVIFGYDPKLPFWQLGALATILPRGEYAFASDLPIDLGLAAIAWGLQAYAFEKYKTKEQTISTLVVNNPKICEQSLQQITAITLIRDLINTPSEDMGPEQLVAAMQAVAKQFAGTVKQWIGKELLQENFPAVHTVGRASDREPRLAVLEWGQATHPLLCIVGKGVCFDTGGYDLKPAVFMRWMKKDMAGAAHALGLAQLIMAAELPIRLQVIIAAVENVVSGNAFKPGDVIKTRKGSTVEVGDTDAEGRLILADALTYAAEQNPALIIDYATLTGSARAAMGPDLPAMFCNQDNIANQLLAAGKAEADPMWRLPLYQPYCELIKSSIADLSNTSNLPLGGAITAALFLQHFVGDLPWIHFDIMAWNCNSRPGRPEGAEAHALRSGFAFVREYFASHK